MSQKALAAPAIVVVILLIAVVGFLYYNNFSSQPPVAGTAGTVETTGKKTTATEKTVEPTPGKEPTPTRLLQWAKESGMRVDDGVSPATIVLKDSRYVMYYTAVGGIFAAKSTDGMNFEKVGVVISDGASNPAIIELNNEYRMIYENNRKLYSAISSDGFNWVKEEGVRLWDYGDGKPGEIFTSVPDIMRLDGGKLRMYYARGATSATAVSNDEGVTWTKETNLDFKRIAVDPDIVRLEDGSYKLFFTTFDSEWGVGDQYVMSANSADGINFKLDEGKRVQPGAGKTMVVDPDVVKLPDGRYRMYYGESGEDMFFRIFSAVVSE